MRDPVTVPVVVQEAGVEYPTMVADGAVVGAETAMKFNCAQRGHHNTLESLPTFLVMELLIAQVITVTKLCCR